MRPVQIGIRVDALGLHPHGPLNLRGATLTNPAGDALNLDQATITDGMFLDRGFAATGQVTMRFATLKVLVGSDKPPAQLVVTGWRLGDIHGVLNDPKTMTSWLDAVPAKEFALQPWHEAAAVYDRQGRPTDAKRLRVAAARRVTARSKLPSKLLRTLYGLFAGYGYYPLLAGVWLIAAAIMAGTLTFFFGATQPLTGGASLDPGLYGAAVVIPPAAGIIPSSWTVTSPLWLAWTLIALKAFGWLQTAILIAGLTGLLKKN